MNFYGSLPESYNIVVNMEHPAVARVMEAEAAEVAALALPEGASDEKKAELRSAHEASVAEFAKGSDTLKQIVDLALLSNGLLKGKALAEFIARCSADLK